MLACILCAVICLLLGAFIGYAACGILNFNHYKTRMGIMEITSVKLKLIPNGGKLVAVASILIDGSMAVTDIKIIRGSMKTFIRMPYKKINGTSRDVVAPINQETRRYIEQTILSAYYNLRDSNPVIRPAQLPSD